MWCGVRSVSVKLTLFGVRRHLLHESDEVEQELRVVAGQFQIVAIFPEDKSKRLQKVKQTRRHHLSPLDLHKENSGKRRKLEASMKHSSVQGYVNITLMNRGKKKRKEKKRALRESL